MNKESEQVAVENNQSEDSGQAEDDNPLDDDEQTNDEGRTEEEQTDDDEKTNEEQKDEDGQTDDDGQAGDDGQTDDEETSNADENMIPCPENIGAKMEELDLSKLNSGVLVGHTSQTSTRIWAYPKDQKPIKIIYQNSSGENCYQITASPRTERSGTSLAIIDGLKGGENYIFDVLIDDQVVTSGRFRTAPVNANVQFKYAFASCMRTNGRPNWEQVGFSKMRSEAPEVLLLLGDNVYSHTVNRTRRLDLYHVPQRGGLKDGNSVRYFWPMIKQVASYAVWDDHDFGGNNSNSDDLKLENEPNATREQSREAFMDAWANPKYGENDQGIFYSFTWGGVEFFMLDGRFFKKGGNAPQGLGGMQLNWLKNGIKDSTATFKIIANGQVLPGNNSGGEGWHRDELAELLQYINENKIKGVVFHGGDVHHNRFGNHERRNISALQLADYDGLYEVVSSAIGNENQNDWVIVDVDTTAQNKSEHKLVFHFYNGESKDPPKDVSISVDSDTTVDADMTILGSQLGW